MNLPLSSVAAGSAMDRFVANKPGTSREGYLSTTPTGGGDRCVKDRKTFNSLVDKVSSVSEYQPTFLSCLYECQGISFPTVEKDWRLLNTETSEQFQHALESQERNVISEALLAAKSGFYRLFVISAR